MALEVARMAPLTGVVTLVSYRRSQGGCAASGNLQCPWYALTAAQDTVYASPWATACLSNCSLCCEVHDFHFLHAQDEAVLQFVKRCLRQLGCR